MRIEALNPDGIGNIFPLFHRGGVNAVKIPAWNFRCQIFLSPFNAGSGDAYFNENRFVCGGFVAYESLDFPNGLENWMTK